MRYTSTTTRAQRIILQIGGIIKSISTMKTETNSGVLIWTLTMEKGVLTICQKADIMFSFPLGMAVP